MSNIRIIIESFISLVLISLPSMFIILTVKNWKFKIKRLIYLTLSLIFGWLSFSLFMNISKNRKEGVKSVCGNYVLSQLDCNKCHDCELFVKPDMTYDIIIKNKKVGNGKWSLGFEGDAGFYYPEFDYGSHGSVSSKSDAIGINRINCPDYWHQEQLNDQFSGTVIDIVEHNQNFDLKALVIRTTNNDTMEYYAKYSSHPMLSTRFSIGDKIIKTKNSLKYVKITLKGDTVIYNFKNK